MRRIALYLPLAATLLAWPTHAAAQTPLSGLLTDLLIDNARDVHVDPNGVNHASHFIEGSQTDANVLANGFNGALIDTITAFPLGSSGGSYVFEGDPALGDFKPASRSFGSAFAERALTIGKHTVSVGVSYQRTHFTSFEGKDLKNGDVSFVFHHSNCCPAANPGAYPSPAFEADEIRESVALDITSQTTALLFLYGVTSKLDVGVVVPITSVSLDATAVASFDRIGTGTNTTIHRFDDGDPNVHTTAASGSASGIGDIVLRAKYRVLPAKGGGLAAGVDLRLPSGDADNLLGLGTTQARVYGSVSTEAGPLFPHANISFAAGGTSSVTNEKLPKEFGYVVGTDAVAGRATVSFDILGRRLSQTSRFHDVNVQDPVDTNGNFVTRTEFLLDTASLTQTYAIVGVKYPIASHLLVTGSAVFSLTDAGLRAKFTPMVGVEYVLTRH
jgi:hypothetical protein